MADSQEKESTGFGIIQLQLEHIKKMLEEHEKKFDKNDKKFEKQEEINQAVKKEINDVATAYGRVELMISNLKDTTDEMKDDVKNISKNIKDDMKEVTDSMKLEISGIAEKAGKDQKWRDILEDIIKVVIMLIAGFGFGKFL